MVKNKALERLNLLRKYGERTGRSYDAENITKPKIDGNDDIIPEVEIGIPLARDSNDYTIDNSVNKNKMSVKSIQKKDNIEELISKSYKSLINSEISSDLFYSSDEDDDLIFKPKEFSRKTEEMEKNKINLYEEIKDRILNIDCSVEMNDVYAQFDSILKSLSNCTNEYLTNSQVVILVSTMITKLEDMNKHNYPELELNGVKDKLNREGLQAMGSGSMREFLFESFYKYYDDIEFKQFTNLTEKYYDRLEQFSEFQKKKSHMLITLLKWLLD
mgnify:CR=1 FL=1